MADDIRSLLEKVRTGEVDVDEAMRKLAAKPFEDIGYAHVDLHRQVRQGVSEVIYGEGKTAEQIQGIIEALRSHGQSSILITRLSKEKAQLLSSMRDVGYELNYDPVSRTAVVGSFPEEPTAEGTILVVSGGTSDIPVAEEAARTAEVLGNRVARIYDIGVAGLHRTLAHMDEITSATVVIAVAGMEGALASVIGGLAKGPVIAVPTSVGYGASLGGFSALLSMLNSCASGVAVVNIDNGFGAAYLASKINHLAG